MAQRSKNTTGKQEKGKPSAKPGQDKAGIKDFDETQNLEREDELRDKYTDEQGNPDPDKVPVKNPNRNTDKTKTDQPKYGGS